MLFIRDNICRNNILLTVIVTDSDVQKTMISLLFELIRLRTTLCSLVILILITLIFLHNCLQCFDAVGWAAGRASSLKKLSGEVAGVVICLERGADLHMAQLMPLPLTVSCFSKIQIGFTFLVPSHLGSPGQRAVKRVCVCDFLTLY